MDLNNLSALALGALLRSGEVSPAQALKAAHTRLHTVQPELNAFITVADEAAPPAQDAAHAPLWGVPMALKDNLCTRQWKTTCASKMLSDYTPPYDATVVERLRDAGSVCMGKLNMDEFSMGSTCETSYFGPVKNPWNKSHVPGGSSGGAAAAVAARSIWYAVGSDTGGSLRQPAAHCGVTGMRPTYGTVSRYGLVAHASSLDQVGPIARSAADCAAVLDMLRGRDSRDSTTLPLRGARLSDRLTEDLRGVRIGLPDECFDTALQPEVYQALQRAAEVLRERGAVLTACSLPAFRYALPAYYILSAAEASSNLARYDGARYGYRALGDTWQARCRNSRAEGFGLEVKRRILLGAFVLSGEHYTSYYQKALLARRLLQRAFAALFQRFDLLLTPVTPTTAPRLGAVTDPRCGYHADAYTVPASLAGLPALSMPGGFDRQGLPIGVQLIGPHLGDSAVLRAAHAFQLETAYHLQAPEGGVHR